MNTIYKFLGVVWAFLLVSCGGEEQKQSSADNSPAVAVKVQKIAANTQNPFVSASGKVQAVNSAELSTRMMGYVTKIYVKVGDRVRKGQLLLSINNSDLQAKKAGVEANIVKAEAAFKNAKKDYERFKNLFAKNSVSQKEMDDMTARYEMAKAGLSAAKQMRNEVNAQFAYADIRAPFFGIVTAKFIDQGALANPGMPLIAVEGKDKFEVVAGVPEIDISKIKKGTLVDVVIKSVSAKIKGRVAEISTSAKNTGGQYLVKIALDKVDTKILSGMFATVHFPIEKTDSFTQIVLIKKDALVKRGQLSGVYSVSTQGRALLRWLRLGRVYGKQVEVLSGLSAGEAYIVWADGKLYNGIKCKVTKVLE